MNTAKPASTAPFTLTLQNFQSEVVDAEKPVLIDFWAPWCGPCRMMGPIFEDAARQLDGQARAAKVNVDEQPELAEAFGIRGIPTLVLIQGNKVLDSWSGVQPAPAVVQRVQSRLAQ